MGNIVYSYLVHTFAPLHISTRLKRTRAGLAETDCPAGAGLCGLEPKG